MPRSGAGPGQLRGARGSAALLDGLRQRFRSGEIFRANALHFGVHALLLRRAVDRRRDLDRRHREGGAEERVDLEPGRAATKR